MVTAAARTHGSAAHLPRCPVTPARVTIDAGNFEALHLLDPSPPLVDALGEGD